MIGWPRWLVVVLKLVGVPIALLIVLSQTMDLSPMPVISTVSIGLLVCGLAFNQLANWTIALRFRASLSATSCAVTRLNAFRIHLQSIFFFFVLPMTVGIELSRMAKLIALDPKMTRISIAIGLFIDRISGVFAAAAVTGIGALWVDFETLGIAMPEFSNTLTAALVVIVVVIATAYWFLRDFIYGKLRLVVWSAVPTIVSWSVVTQLLFCIACWMVTTAFQPDVGMIELLMIVSASNLLVAIPVSFAGASLAEAGATGLWLLIGYSVETAVLLALVPYGLRLLIAIQGAVWEVMSGASILVSSSRQA